MAKKGIRRQAVRMVRQKINKQENKMYYQNGTEWHSPSTPNEIAKRRILAE